MNKNIIIQEAEKFMRENIPKSRITKDGSDEIYLRHVLGVKKYALQLGETYNEQRLLKNRLSKMPMGLFLLKIHSNFSLKNKNKNFH